MSRRQWSELIRTEQLKCVLSNHMLTKYLKKTLQRKHQEAIKSQNWQGKFLSTVWNDEDLAEQYFAYMGWKNIPDYIETHARRDYAATTPNVCVSERTSKQTGSSSRMSSLQLFGRKSLPCHVQLPPACPRSLQISP